MVPATFSSDVREEILDRLQLFGRKRMAAFENDDPLADGHRRIGAGAHMGRPRGKHLLVVVERQPRGHRDDDLPLEVLADRGDDPLDLVGFHGDDDHVGKVGHLGGRVKGVHAARFGIALQLGPVTGADPDLAPFDRSAADQSARQGLSHVSKSDKSDFHTCIDKKAPHPEGCGSRFTDCIRYFE